MSIKPLPCSQASLTKMLQIRDESNRAGLVDPVPSRMDFVIHYEENKGRGRHFALMENNGRVIGCALFIWERLNIFPTQIDALNSAYEMGIRWGISEAKRLGKSTLSIRPRDVDITPISIIETMEFEKLENATPRMVRSLLEDLPGATVPPEYKIRPLRGIEDLESWAKMRLTTYGSEVNEENIRNTMESHKKEMAYESYDPTLEIVAEYKDGSLAAYYRNDTYDDILQPLFTRHHTQFIP